MSARPTTSRIRCWSGPPKPTSPIILAASDHRAERNPGGTTLPHYHVPTEACRSPARHQVLICQRGKARVGIFTRQGQPLGEVIMRANDVVLLLEGHEVEFLERGTRLIEIKQGPFPGTDADDKVDLKVTAA